MIRAGRFAPTHSAGTGHTSPRQENHHRRRWPPPASNHVISTAGLARASPGAGEGGWDGGDIGSPALVELGNQTTSAGRPNARQIRPRWRDWRTPAYSPTTCQRYQSRRPAAMATLTAGVERRAR
jgi:hypothetical protein